jgi:hypothetical protein
MLDIEPVLSSLVRNLSDENYEQSLDRYHFWFDFGQTHSQIPSDLIFKSIWSYRNKLTTPDYLIFPTSPLILRFVGDVESSHILAPHNAGLRSRLCTSVLQEFFDTGVRIAYEPATYWMDYLMDANLIAHCANHGYIEEATIRHHILQSFIYHPTLRDHLADAILIFFIIAGATFEAYVDPSVIDHCFGLLKGYRRRAKHINVSKLCQGSMVGTKIHLQDVIKLRQSGWKGLPPPPIFTAKEQEPIGTGQKDPSKTPVVISLGLPNVDLEPQMSLPPVLESITAPEMEATPASPALTQSPSISIATLSDFTMTDTPDDQSPIDPTEITPHDTFYLEDGNVEVLCESTLFRIHIGVLSFHSPVLRQGFAQAILATAESPNGCPRIPSSDTAMDFTTLLQMIYLPG